jgi:hypothetical protein
VLQKRAVGCAPKAVRVTQHGMKELDWSAFHEGLTENKDGSGTIDMLVPHPASIFTLAYCFP